MGGVLIEWNPARIVARIGLDGEDAALLRREVFAVPEWVGLDRGRLTEEEALAVYRRRLPERLHEAAERCVFWWREPLWPIAGMAGLIGELKAAGCGIYLLSNATSALHEYFPRIPGAAHFDGGIVSADHKLLKPQHEIYELLFSRCALDPADCFFIDDSPLNVDGAICCGMQGAVFHGEMAELRGRLRDAGIRF